MLVFACNYDCKLAFTFAKAYIEDAFVCLPFVITIIPCLNTSTVKTVRLRITILHGSPYHIFD